MKKIICKSEIDTKKAAIELAQKLHGGEILGLVGNLGAGKTIFTKYLAEALGVRNTVNSPTFVIMKIYNANFNKIKRFVHIDAYRLCSGEELTTLGFLEYANDPKSVIVVEWANLVKNVLPKKTIFIEFKHLDERERKLVVK